MDLRAAELEKKIRRVNLTIVVVGLAALLYLGAGLALASRFGLPEGGWLIVAWAPVVVGLVAVSTLRWRMVLLRDRLFALHGEGAAAGMDLRRLRLR